MVAGRPPRAQHPPRRRPPPSLAQEQQELKVSWQELFYDLVYVAYTYNVTHLLMAKPDAEGFGQFILYYTIMFFIWASNVSESERARLCTCRPRSCQRSCLPHPPPCASCRPSS